MLAGRSAPAGRPARSAWPRRGRRALPADPTASSACCSSSRRSYGGSTITTSNGSAASTASTRWPSQRSGVVAHDRRRSVRPRPAARKVGGDDPGRPGVVLDERGRRRAARQRFDAGGAAAGEQVEAPGRRAGRVRGSRTASASRGRQAVAFPGRAPRGGCRARSRRSPCPHRPRSGGALRVGLGNLPQPALGELGGQRLVAPRRSVLARRAAPRRDREHEPPAPGGRAPGSRRPAGAAARSGRDRGRRPRGGARSPSRQARTRRAARRPP